MPSGESKGAQTELTSLQKAVCFLWWFQSMLNTQQLAINLIHFVSEKVCLSCVSLVIQAVFLQSCQNNENHDAIQIQLSIVFRCQ